MPDSTRPFHGRPGRRTVLTGLGAVPLLAACGGAGAEDGPAGSVPVSGPRAFGAPAGAGDPGFAALERRYGARLGVFARHCGTGRTIGHRQTERFPMCSTFKTYAVGALLKEHPVGGPYLSRTIRYTRDDLLPHSPVTAARVDTGMTVTDLCEATITTSDNTAANLLLELLGGPGAVTRFARALGDTSTRLDQWEPNLSTAPGDERDTTTPQAIGDGYRELVLGDTLPAAGRERLTRWLIAATTGARRIRAGLPADQVTGDKTGTGGYGTANDIAVTWPAPATPLVIAVLSTRPEPEAAIDEALLAEAARIAAGVLSPGR